MVQCRMLLATGVMQCPLPQTCEVVKSVICNKENLCSVRTLFRVKAHRISAVLMHCSQWIYKPLRTETEFSVHQGMMSLLMKEYKKL